MFVSAETIGVDKAEVTNAAEGDCRIADAAMSSQNSGSGKRLIVIH